MGKSDKKKISEISTIPGAGFSVNESISQSEYEFEFMLFSLLRLFPLGSKFRVSVTSANQHWFLEDRAKVQIKTGRDLLANK